MQTHRPKSTNSELPCDRPMYESKLCCWCTVLFNGFCRLCLRLRAALLYVGFLHGHLQVCRILHIFKDSGLLPFFTWSHSACFPSVGWVKLLYEVLLVVLIPHTTILLLYYYCYFSKRRKRFWSNCNILIA
jgi:hypothetical protein